LYRWKRIGTNLQRINVKNKIFFHRKRRDHFNYSRSGEFGSFKELEKLTLERIQNVKPNR
jgi:hypothetical protein